MSLYSRRFTLFLLAALFAAGTVLAAPRAPSDPAEILAHLPARAPVADPAAPLDQVRALLLRAQRDGDPRPLGQAEARLAPVLAEAEPPVAARVLHARLLQAGHHFDAALAELDRVPITDPEAGDALLLRAAIHQVRAEYDAARTACAELGRLELLLPGLICAAQIDGLSGDAQAAYARLERIGAFSDRMTPEQQAWHALALGDLADRLGFTTAAGAAYARVHGWSPDTMAAWADWLLEAGRAAEVLDLLAGYEHDGLLLRRALAGVALGSPSAAADRRELAARFAALRLRGDRTHLREEAHFALRLDHDARNALELARANWEQQREPADARIYAEAASAAGSEGELALLREWQARTGLEDVRLEAALDGTRLAGASGAER